MQDENLGLCIYSVSRAAITDETWKEISVAVLGSSYSVESGNVGILLGKPFGAENAVSYGKIISYEEKVKKSRWRIWLLRRRGSRSLRRNGVIANLEGQIIELSHKMYFRIEMARKKGSFTDMGFRISKEL